jgi:hypothetical protein
VLRGSESHPEASRRVLAISASPSSGKVVVPPVKAASRNVYDIDPAKLRPLPAADDEARSVGKILDPEGATVLLEDGNGFITVKSPSGSERQSILRSTVLDSRLRPQNRSASENVIGWSPNRHR